MLFILILFIIGIYTIYHLEVKGFIEILGSFITNILISISFGLLLALIVGSFYDTVTEYDTENPIYLQAISNKSDIQGEFFLGSGIINNKNYYYYYYITEEGYIQDKIRVDDVIIDEEENCERPRILRGYNRFTSRSYFALPTQSKNNYKIIVPKNSVKKAIDFDL